ncbi:unnamed protein product [Phytophthora fragariaefolia]|uniref:Unnamed protein product n=1 Tax=Phytophthora fragariaefolia TaxID=1490495 RepID=A0A9W6TPQ2_9STRA|nr:unnamed protein product [Phytophthora fragariaefolia]
MEPTNTKTDQEKPTVILNGVFELPYCADSGSDYNIVSQNHVDQLRQFDRTLSLVKLSEPVESRAVGGAILISTHAIDVNLTLNTAAGPVRCQDLKRCLIVESDEDGFLVGKLLLAELGIDVDRQLEYLAVRGDDDKTFDEPQSMPLYKPTIAGVVMKVVDALVSDAIQRGVIDDYITTRLYTVLHRFGGWRLEVSDDPPARVPPLKIRLKAGASPYRCKLRQYSPEKSEFFDAFNKKLVELGWVFENRESPWCCPALPVKNPSSNEYRQTVDYRPTNALTEPIAGVMPSIEVALEHCRGMMFYVMLDFLKGFWQLPFHESRREYLSYMTDRGIFTPTRVPQGSTDAALHFQSTVEMALGNLVNKCVIVWIDDLLIFAKTTEELVDAIDAVLQKLDEFGFILNPQKCSLFMTEVRWCGRIINKDGIGHDPSRIQALMDMPPPTTAAELQQFICASNWMWANLVDYARVARPPQERLDSALSGTKKTKRAAAEVKFELTWEELKSFRAVKNLLAHSATLTYPDPSKQLILMSDASDMGWGLVVTQVCQWKPEVPIHQQTHELLICMRGSFTGSALNWSVIEKESFPIIHACERLEYLLLRPQGFKLYCDHRNIVYLFAPRKELKNTSVESCYDGPRSYSSIGNSFGTSRYVLVLKDEATHFAELVACDSPTSAVAASTILDWYSRFGAPKLWISDSGSHFKNKVVAELIPNAQACESRASTSNKTHWPRPHYEQTVNFSVGDYVLRSRVDEKLHANKLRIMWVGPYRVVGSAEYYFTVEHLVNGSTMDVHPSRLKLYADDSLNVTKELLDHIASQGTLLAVEAIVDHKLNSDMEA